MRIVANATLAIVLAALFSACDSSDDNLTTSPIGAPDFTQVQIIHAVANAPTVGAGTAASVDDSNTMRKPRQGMRWLTEAMFFVSPALRR